MNQYFYLIFLAPIALGILGTYFGVKKLAGVEYVKSLFPLTLMVFAGAAAFINGRQFLSCGVAIGLFFCIIADFLLGKRDNSRVFIFGLVGFLLGYLVYGITFFLQGGPGLPAAGAAAVLGCAAVIQYRTMKRLDPSLRIPVAVYMTVVSFLVFGAVCFSLDPRPSAPRKALVLLGTLLIYLSDSLIAHNLFRNPIEKSDFFVLPPYYAGQIFITLSLFIN
jgi:uncharacterized membrane protein YhhN